MTPVARPGDPGDSAGPCRYCDEPLTRDSYRGQTWYYDADGGTLCPAASVTCYLGHEPRPPASTTTRGADTQDR